MHSIFITCHYMVRLDVGRGMRIACNLVVALGVVHRCVVCGRVCDDRRIPLLQRLVEQSEITMVVIVIQCFCCEFSSSLEDTPQHTMLRLIYFQLGLLYVVSTGREQLCFHVVVIFVGFARQRDRFAMVSLCLPVRVVIDC